MSIRCSTRVIRKRLSSLSDDLYIHEVKRHHSNSITSYQFRNRTNVLVIVTEKFAEGFENAWPRFYYFLDAHDLSGPITFDH